MQRGGLFAFALLFLISAHGSAAQIYVPAGVTMAIDGASLHAGAYHLVVDGTLNLTHGTISVLSVTIGSDGELNAGSGKIEVAVDWANSGTFNAGTGIVVFTDGSHTTAAITGETTFYDLTFTSSSGKTYLLPTGGGIVVQNNLRMLGVAGSPIRLESVDPVQQASIAVGGIPTLEQATLERVEITTARGGSPEPIPALGPAGLGLLTVLIVVLTLFRLGRLRKVVH
jgi:hypothetical protein